MKWGYRKKSYIYVCVMYMYIYTYMCISTHIYKKTEYINEDKTPFMVENREKERK